MCWEEVSYDASKEDATSVSSCRTLPIHLWSYTSYTPVLYQYIYKLCNPLAKVSPADVVLVRIQQQVKFNQLL